MGFSLLSSFGNFYPWPILLPPCVPLLHQHSLSEMVMLCILTLTHLSPHSAVSIQQAEIWHGESRQCQQLCNGRHVGHSSGQAVGWGGGVSIVRDWRVMCRHLFFVSYFYPSPCMKEAIWLLPVMDESERVCDTFALWVCLSPAHLFSCTRDKMPRSVTDHLCVG